MYYKEIEARFLEVNKEDIIRKLKVLNAVDLGEDFLEEIIYYDKDYKWRDVENKFVRLRKSDKCIKLAYKHYVSESLDGVEEIEFTVSSMQNAQSFLERLGLVQFRYQQKKRHTFQLNNIEIVFDTWPKIPTYIEIEGNSESEIKRVVELLQLNWNDAVFENARSIIENKYKIPVGQMKYFKFDSDL